MDPKTINAYNTKPKTYVDTWLAQESPLEKSEWLTQAFQLNEPTADIGSGSGRDVDWLNQASYPTIGFDASHALIQEARKLYPKWNFHFACLPNLSEIPNHSFQNILCQTVIMHLPENLVEAAIKNLHRCLKPKGSLLLSYRQGKEISKDLREKDLRLYSNLDAKKITETWCKLGGSIEGLKTHTLSRTKTPLTEIWLKKTN